VGPSLYEGWVDSPTVGRAPLGGGTMNVDRKRVEALFLAAVDLEPPARAQLLDGECAGQPALRAEVLAMLEAARASEQYFSELSDRFGAARLLEGGSVDTSDSAAPARQIGPYRLLSLLGRGGMGAVWLAERADEQYHKRVALKTLPVGLAGPGGHRRFLTERQILARLVHPGIARMLDGGVAEDGTPWFVMDYVEGEPIDAWCDRQRLGIEARLTLWLQVCAAVQYAHANLVVHRDLKPANVLVDAAGNARLLDFGIAKILEAGESDMTLTRVEGRPLTPLYASPEMLRGEPVTTAADVYALGVLLYVLLCGRPPFDLQGLTGGEITRRVSEQAPARPSAAVSSIRVGPSGTDGPSLELIARARALRPEQLGTALAGDLDTMVLKAMAKEPTERYASVEQFAEDVQRYLRGQPVRARAPTWTYRARKFLARHPAGVSAAGTVAVLLAVILLMSINYSLTSSRQAAAIAAERDRAESIKGFLLDLFREADPNQAKGVDVTAREILDRGAQQVERELAGQPLTQADLMQVLADIYGALSEHERAGSLLDEAISLRAHADDRGSAGYADALEARSDVASITGNYPQAQSLAERALALRRVLDDEAATGKTALRLGVVLHRRGHTDDAQRYYGEALEIARALPGGPTDLLPATLHAYGSLLQQQGRLDEAGEMHREGLSVRHALFGDDYLELVGSYFNLGEVQYEQGELDAAKGSYEQALAISRKLTPEGNADDAYMLNSLAMLEGDRGDPVAAEARFREALELLTRYYDPGHPNTALVSANLGMLLAADETRHREAASLLRSSLATLDREIPDHPKVDQVRDILRRLPASADGRSAVERP
jgi:serine/threonine protein kinase/Tfp pilus assembly protein PilF